MLSTIVGSIIIVSGLVVLINPDRLRRRLKKKGTRAVKRSLVAATCSVGALLISTGWRYEGLLPKLIAVAGILFVLKAMHIAKAKSGELITDRLMKVPVLYLRLFASLQIAFGIIIITMLGK